MRRFGPANLRAAAWAGLELFRIRRHLRRRGLAGARVQPPPRLPDDAVRGVEGALRRGGASCLECSLVLQQWHAAHGRRRDVVIGVTAPTGTFAAHAWLDGDDHEQGDFAELRRLAVP